jgi:hypothetical protein
MKEAGFTGLFHFSVFRLRTIPFPVCHAYDAAIHRRTGGQMISLKTATFLILFAFASFSAAGNMAGRPAVSCELNVALDSGRQVPVKNRMPKPTHDLLLNLFVKESANPQYAFSDYEVSLTIVVQTGKTLLWSETQRRIEIPAEGGHFLFMLPIDRMPCGKEMILGYRFSYKSSQMSTVITFENATGLKKFTFACEKIKKGGRKR